MARQVKCKICGEKIASDTAYCIEKINEKTGKKTRSYYCSKEEYDKDKYNQVDIEKLFCSECGREFLQFSYNSDYLNCYDVNPIKIKDLDRTEFTWDKWIDPNER